MAGRRRSAAELTRDRRRITDLYLSGWTQTAIAEELGVSQQTISLDLKAVQKDWLASSLIDFDAAKAKELAKVDRLEREYWAAWEASKEDKETSVTEKAGGEKPRSKAQIRREGQVGNPSFLSGVQWCIERRCKILGIDAPQKMQVLSDNDLDAAIATELARLAAVGKAPDVRAAEGDGRPAETPPTPPETTAG